MFLTRSQNSSNGGGKKWSDSNYVFEPTVLDNGSDTGCQEKSVNSGLDQEIVHSVGSTLTVWSFPAAHSILRSRHSYSPSCLVTSMILSLLSGELCMLKT